ncbi:MAG: thioredoxin domain-containing protein [Metallosphaera sp.]|uniref:thioredoxin domain-containing protein n=1 Tax=Metallosphaera sp. TaxID=2020860 RepID=UPI00316A0320
MNKLANSSSAFLRESANQEIDWYPWSDEAFERARKEDKPVLVDVGAVWCHWCHVMDKETYSNPEIVNMINQHFVAIKVDRDEMPDLDRKLQRAVTSITGESGWPLTVFMTPNGEVFFGGTYFPPVDSYGRIGMARLLKEVARLWKEERDKIRESSLSITDYTPSSGNQVNFDTVEVTMSSIISSYDIEQGGLGNTMKFPHPTVDQLMLAYSFWTGDQVSSKLSTFTLKKMFHGGIFDQVGGGFHRYAIDREWNVPHFEKLLIDNAELIEDYHDNYLYTRDPIILEGLKLTVEYVLRDLWTKEGFASSMDADVDDIEGGYYIWKWDELVRASGEWKELVEKVFSLVGEQALEGGVVRVKQDLNDLSKRLSKDVKALLDELRLARKTLREYRDSTRKRPFRDDNLYTYPNSRMAYALLTSYPVTGYGVEEALQVVNKINRKITRRLNGGGEGLLEDYASALLASIKAYSLTGEMRYRNVATELGEELKGFMTNQGFVERRGSSEIANMDTPNESPNSLALKALISLSQIEEIEVPEQTVSSIIGDYVQGPPFYAGAIYSLGSLLNGIAHVVVVDSGDGKAENLHKEALLTYHPFKVVELVKEENRDVVRPIVRAMINQGERSRAFICIKNSCSLPVYEPEKIKLLLKSR